MKMRRIRFKKKDLELGAHIVMRSGLVVFLGDGLISVPESTVEILERRQVPFIEIERGNGAVPAVRNLRSNGVRRSRKRSKA